MKQPIFASLAALSLIAVASPAASHTRLMTPAPLTQDDNAKAGPCGCFFGAGPEDPAEDGSPLPCPEDFQVTTLQAGTELTVTWEETVNHNGDFRIAFSSKAPANTGKADVDATILMEIPDENGTSGGKISQKIMVPNEPCELCTIQLRQFMIGAAQPYYYSCAAVKIVGEDPTTSSSSTGAGGGSSGGNGGMGGNGGAGAGAGASNGQGGEAGSTGAGMADPAPKIEDGCSVEAGRIGRGVPGGALAIVGVAAIAGLVRRRRRG